MAHLVHAANRSRHFDLLAAMHRDRKSVFVDSLGWDLDVQHGLEIDRFDGPDADYLILQEPRTGDHLASLRLLRTDRPHLLDSMFPELCDEDIPSGPGVREISRLCLSPRYSKMSCADYRAHMATALVEYGLFAGVRAFTAVIEARNLSALLSRGWRCCPIGPPRDYGQLTLLALRIDVDARTVELLRRAGNYREHCLQCAPGAALIAA